MLKHKFVAESPEVTDPFSVFGICRRSPLLLWDPWGKDSRTVDLPVIRPDTVECDEKGEAPDRSWDECG